jgi:hypothetical protein
MVAERAGSRISGSEAEVNGTRMRVETVVEARVRESETQLYDVVVHLEISNQYSKERSILMTQ